MFLQETDTAIDTLVAQTLVSGGSTVSVTGQTVPTDGFMVGGYADSLIFDSGVLNHGNVAYKMVMRYVNQHFKMLVQKDMFLGGWIDTDENLVYIDIAQRFDSRRIAIHTAIEHDEIAIWDLEKAEEIRVS